ncbi:MAG: (2Fe-2S) ferredoxin domain-containing protein [Anaerolineales bacterium]
MEKLKSVQELQEFQNRVKLDLEHVKNENVIITVGTGTCGLAAGAGETLEQIQIELEKRNISAIINRVGCIGICVREPLVDVQLPGAPRVTYANVKPPMVARIIEEHVVNGSPVKEWVLGIVPEDW